MKQSASSQILEQIRDSTQYTQGTKKVKWWMKPFINMKNVSANTDLYNQLMVEQYKNAYNSPEEQMQRYKDAGLNPMQIYSQGNAGSTDMTAPLGNDGVNYTNSVFQAGFNIVSSLLGLRMQNAQVSEIAMRNLKAKAEIQEIIQNTFNKKIEGMHLLRGLDKLDAEIKKLKNESELLEIDKIIQNAFANNVDLEIALKKANLSQQQQQIGLNYINALKGYAELKGIELDNAIKDFNLTNLKPLERQIQEFTRDSMKLSNDVDKDFTNLSEQIEFGDSGLANATEKLGRFALKWLNKKSK